MPLGPELQKIFKEFDERLSLWGKIQKLYIHKIWLPLYLKRERRSWKVKVSAVNQTPTITHEDTWTGW